MFGRMDEAESTAQEVAEIYRQASADLNKRMKSVFSTYQTKWNLTEAEAGRLLNRMHGRTDIAAMRSAALRMPAGEAKDAILQELESPAYRARIRRLQDLQTHLDQMMTAVYRQDHLRQQKHYINTGRDAYYHGIYDIQHQTGLGFSFNTFDENQFSRLLHSKWSGDNYSQRIWDNTQKVAETVKQELSMELLTGRRLSDCAAGIAKRFLVGAFGSRRLIRTESNFIAGQMQMQAYEECGSDEYQYVAILDDRTCPETCGRLDGQRFKLQNARVGVNMHPMHPFCRCTTIMPLDDDVIAGLERRAKDPRTGKTIKVPSSMTYEEWKKKYIDSAAEPVLSRAKKISSEADLLALSGSDIIKMHSHDEISQFFARNHHVEVSGFEKQNLFDSKAVLAGYDDFFQMFPESSEVVKKIQYSSGLKNSNASIELFSGVSKVGRFGLRDYGTGIHEAAHALDYARSKSEDLAYSRGIVEQARKNLKLRADAREYRDLCVRMVGPVKDLHIYSDPHELFAYALESELGGASNRLSKEILRLTKGG